MLNRIQRVQRFSETLARNTMTGDMQDKTGLPGDSEGDDMGVEIGDRVTNHYHGRPAGMFTKAAIAAALLASAFGAGATAMWGLEKLSSPPVVETPADADTQYEARFEVE